MDRRDKREEQRAELLTKMLAPFAEIYGRNLSEAVMKLWAQVLDRFEDADIERAFKKWLEQGHRMPVPADIISSIEGSEIDHAEEAWGAVMRAMEEHGYAMNICFLDDPCIHSVIKGMGGWQYLCELDTSELNSWRKKDFLGLYRVYSGNKAKIHPPHIRGCNTVGQTAEIVVHGGKTKRIGMGQTKSMEIHPLIDEIAGRFSGEDS